MRAVYSVPGCGRLAGACATLCRRPSGWSVGPRRAHAPGRAAWLVFCQTGEARVFGWAVAIAVEISVFGDNYEVFRRSLRHLPTTDCLIPAEQGRTFCRLQMLRCLVSACVLTGICAIQWPVRARELVQSGRTVNEIIFSGPGIIMSGPEKVLAERIFLHYHYQSTDTSISLPLSYRVSHLGLPDF